jgi:hypothetical protein
MDPHQARDEQLVSQFVLLVVSLNIPQSVVKQHSIARGLVDSAVEDVGQDLAL